MRHLKLYKILGIIFIFAFAVLFLMYAMSGTRPTGSLFLINGAVEYKENHTIDVISDLMLYASFGFVALAIVLGIMQLVKNKSLLKVERIIIVFGIFTVIALALWILFDKVICVSYRPLADESSFPSTHVFVFTFFVLTGKVFVSRFIKNSTINKLITIVAIVLIILMPVLRVMAGQHYITDTIGGLELGLALYFLTVGFGFKKQNENNNSLEEDE